MEASPRNAIRLKGISVITCTNRRNFLRNLFDNYARQRHSKKELIIVVNNDRIPLSPYRRLARKHSHIRIFRLPERSSLGACLNFAVKQAKYPYIAKFDDDDYYAPYYLADSLLALKRTNADVMGKRAHYMYLQGSKTLLLRFPQDENRPASRLPGATLVFKRKVFDAVRFPNRSVGEDDLFCLRSKKAGFKVFSGGKYNFVAVRRKNSAGHTWIISDRTLMDQHRRVPNVRNYRKFVGRKPEELR